MIAAVQAGPIAARPAYILSSSLTAPVDAVVVVPVLPVVSVTVVPALATDSEYPCKKVAATNEP